MAKRRKEWPPWWDWEVELVEHVYKRMSLREFTEIDLRRMMEHAVGYRSHPEPGRWIIETRFRRQRWEIIVEPIPEKQILAVISAYDVWKLK